MSKRRSIVRGFDNLRTMGEYLQATARQNRKDAEDVAARKALQALQAEDQGFQREQMEWGREDQKRQNAEAVAKGAEARAESFQRARVSKNLEEGNPKRAARIAFNRGIALPDHVVDLYSPPKDKLAELEDELKLRARYREPKEAEKPDVTADDVLRDFGNLRDLEFGAEGPLPEGVESASRAALASKYGSEATSGLFSGSKKVKPEEVPSPKEEQAASMFVRMAAMSGAIPEPEDGFETTKDFDAAVWAYLHGKDEEKQKAYQRLSDPAWVKENVR